MFKGYGSHSMCVCLSQASCYIRVQPGTGLISVVYNFLGEDQCRKDQCSEAVEDPTMNPVTTTEVPGTMNPVVTTEPPDPGTTCNSGIMFSKL